MDINVESVMSSIEWDDPIRTDLDFVSAVQTSHFFTLWLHILMETSENSVLQFETRHKILLMTDF